MKTIFYTPKFYILLLLLLGTGMAQAATLYWRGAKTKYTQSNSSLSLTGNNWSAVTTGGTLVGPGTGNDLVFDVIAASPGISAYTISAALNCNSLAGTLSGASAGNRTYSITISAPLTVTNAFSLGNATTTTTNVNYLEVFLVAGGSVDCGSFSMDNTAAGASYTGQFTNGLALETASGTSFTTGSFSVSSSQVPDNTGTYTNLVLIAGTLNVSGATSFISTNGSASFNNYNVFGLANGGIANLTGTFNCSAGAGINDYNMITGVTINSMSTAFSPDFAFANTTGILNLYGNTTLGSNTWFVSSNSIGAVNFLGGTSFVPQQLVNNATASFITLPDVAVGTAGTPAFVTVSGTTKAFSTVSGKNLTVNTGSVLDMGTTKVTSAGSATFSLLGTGTLKLAASNFPAAYTTNTLATGSTVIYNGAGAQAIAPVTYYNLTASSTGPLTLSGTATVNGTATFTNGAVTGGTVALAAGAATAVTPGTASYVNGTASHSGSTGYLLPVGNAAATGTVYHPLAYSTPAAATTVQAAYGTATPNVTSMLSLAAVDPAAYWSFASSTAGATAAVSLTTRDETNVFESGATVVVAGYRIATGKWEPLSAPVTPTGDNQVLTSNSIDMSLYSAFAVASDNAYIFPVTLTSFTGTVSNCTAKLSWTTATELNSSYYDVLVSTNGTTFTSVAHVASKNNASGAAYTYTDNTLSSGTSYYRLKLVDKDGRFGQSDMINVISNCAESPLITAGPNPAVSRITVTGTATGSRITVYDITGKKLTTVTATGSSQTLNVSGYAKGTYLISVQTANGKISNVKLVKE